MGDVDNMDLWRYIDLINYSNKEQEERNIEDAIEALG